MLQAYKNWITDPFHEKFLQSLLFLCMEEEEKEQTALQSAKGLQAGFWLAKC